MPTVHREGAYRFFFYSHEPNEAPHVHVERDDRQVKVWLDPIRISTNRGFRLKELGCIIAIVRSRRTSLLESWYAHFPYRPR